MHPVILHGGGPSINKGREKGLYDKIRKQEIWSLNYAFLTMPYLPDKELWVDNKFFSSNKADLEELMKEDVDMIAKFSTRYEAIDNISGYHTTTERPEYRRKNSLEEDCVFRGKLGLIGTFALTVAICMDYISDIWILGYDYGTPEPNNKNTHYYKDEIDVVSDGIGNTTVYRQNNGKLKDSVHDYKVFKADKDRIYNVSPQSNIPEKYIPKITYDEFFKRIKNEYR